MYLVIIGKALKKLNFYFLDQSIVSISNILLNILVARFLGLYEFGVFSLVWMVYFLALGLQAAFIFSPMLSIGAKCPDSRWRVYIGAVLGHQVIFTILFVTIILITYLIGSLFIFSDEYNILLVSFILFVVTSNFQEWIRRYYFIRGEAANALLIDLINFIGRIVFVFILFELNVVSTVSDVFFALSAIVLVSMLYGRDAFRACAWGGLKKFYIVSRRHWRSSAWLGMSSVMQWVSGTYLIVLSGYMLGVGAVGGLKAAQSILGMIMMILQIIDNVLPPFASREYVRGGVNSLGRVLRYSLVFGGIVIVAIALIIIASADSLMGIIYGDEFVEYGYLLQWFALIGVLMFVGFPLRIGLRTIEYTKPIFYGYVSVFVCALLVAYPLIEAFGLLGVMMSFLLFQIVLQVILWYSLCSKLKSTSFFKRRKSEGFGEERQNK